jgi:hypothetical protein
MAAGGSPLMTLIWTIIAGDTPAALRLVSAAPVSRQPHPVAIGDSTRWWGMQDPWGGGERLAAGILALALAGASACGRDDSAAMKPAGDGVDGLASALAQLTASAPEAAAAGTGATARLLAPLSGSIAGSGRPLLRWTGAAVAVVELCAGSRLYATGRSSSRGD